MISRMEGSRKVDPLSLQEELARIFQHYTVTYSVMTDTFRIRNGAFDHRLLYNTHKASRLESRSRAVRRFTLYVNLGILGLVFLLVILDQRLGWDLIGRPVLASDHYFFGLILLLGLMPHLIPVLKPGLKRELEREHRNVRQTLEDLLVDKMT